MTVRIQAQDCGTLGPVFPILIFRPWSTKRRHLLRGKFGLFHLSWGALVGKALSFRNLGTPQNIPFRLLRLTAFS